MDFTSIWDAGVAICYTKGWTVTGAFMHHAKNGNGKTLTFYNDSEVLNKIRQTSAYRNCINSWISEYKTSGKKEFHDGIEFTSNCEITDLHAALQHVDIDGYIQDNGNLYVEISDTYDFTEWRQPFQKSFFPAANDFGVVMQYINAIKPFKVYIKGYEWAGKYTGSSSSSSSSSSYSYKKARVTASVLNVRSGPSTNNSKIGEVYNGEIVVIKWTEPGWHYIIYDTSHGKKEGYVYAKYIQIL
ncbi:SH3 domain-containing protein (plasmid) [Clostridium perfringens]|nr:SH3 domain-containing protein [Clostridium perfringens]